MKIQLTAHWRERVPGEELEVSDAVGLGLISDGVARALTGDAAGIAEPAEPAQPVEVPPKSGAGSGRDAWADYAESKGVTVDETAVRDEIIAALDNAGIATAVIDLEDDDEPADT